MLLSFDGLSRLFESKDFIWVPGKQWFLFDIMGNNPDTKQQNTTRNILLESPKTVIWICFNTELLFQTCIFEIV